MNVSKNRLFNVVKFAYKNSGSLLVIKALGIAINYIALILILRLLGAQGNGEVANFIAQSKGLMIFFVFGLDVLLVKKMNTATKDLEALLDIAKTLLLNFIIGTLFFFLINLVVEVSYLFLVGGVILALWRFVSHFYRGKNNMLAYGFFEFIVFQTSIAISVLINKYFKVDFINSILYTNILFITVFLLYFSVSNAFVLKTNFSLKINSLKKIYLQSYHFLLSNSIIIISTSVLYYIIKTNYSTAVLGFYDGILKFSLVIALPLIATNGRVMFMTSKFFNSNALTDLRNYIKTITKMLAVMSTGAAVAVTGVFFVYSTYFNTDFQSYWVLFGILVSAQLINNWAGPVGLVLQLTNNEKIYNLLTFITSVYLILSTIIIAKTLSINYIALNYLIYMLFQNIASLLIVKKKLNINPYKL